MALSGLEIFKKLPKTNCKDCGFPTCLAFAMQLAAGKVELDKCPHVTEEAKQSLSEASQPPVLKVEIGAGDDALTLGEETVMFRHDRTFVNQNAFMVNIDDSEEDSMVKNKIKAVNELQYDRVGQVLSLSGICLSNSSKDKSKFMDLVEKVSEATSKPLILMTEDTGTLKEAASKLKDKRPLLHCANKDNIDEMIKTASETGCPVVVRGKDFEEVASLTSKMRDAGIKNVIIDIGQRSLKDDFINQIIIRRAAVKKQDRLFGYPTIVFPNLIADDPLKETMVASIFVAKYGSIIVISNADPANVYPLLVYRQNIYTDPRKPMQVEQKIYELGNPGKDSPVLLTTNFSLTYFIISGEIENSKVPAWLLVMDVEGQSVLTAWAAGKFVPELIAQFVSKSGIEEKTDKREIIIPGYVAQLQGELEDELEGKWKIVVGPREAGEVPKFLKNYAEKTG